MLFIINRVKFVSSIYHHVKYCFTCCRGGDESVAPESTDMSRTTSMKKMKSQLSESSCFDDNRSIYNNNPTQQLPPLESPPVQLGSNFPYIADGVSPRPIMKHVSAIGMESLSNNNSVRGKAIEQRPGNIPRRLISHNYVRHSQSIQEPSTQVDKDEEPKRAISINKSNKNIESDGENENTGTLTPINPSPNIQSMPSSKIFTKAIARVYLFIYSFLI